MISPRSRPYDPAKRAASARSAGRQTALRTGADMRYRRNQARALAADGLTPAQIAQRMGLTVRTVREYLRPADGSA